MFMVKFFVLSMAIFFLSSCNSPEMRDLRRFSMAERLLGTEPQEAMNIYQSIPDTVNNALGFYRYHDHLCLANMHYYKALNSIDNGNIDEAYQQVCNLVEANALAYQQTRNGKRLLQKELQVLWLLEPHRPVLAVNSSARNDSIVKTLTKALGNLRPQSLQHVVAEQTAQTEYFYFHHHYYLPLVVLLLCVVCFLIYQQHKSDEYENSLVSKQSQQNALNEKIALLKENIRANEEEIRRLSDLSASLHHQTKQGLGIGKTFYEKIESGGDIKNISIEDEQHFIDYFAFLHPAEFDAIVQPFKTLSLRHTTYLILQKMGFSDPDIQRILFVKASTIRNYRLRINRNKKQ